MTFFAAVRGADAARSAMEIYAVGGAVRDALLGRAVEDRDWVVVGATAEEMIARGFRPVGRDFPVFLHPETNEEYALARTERKTAPGYRGFAVHADPSVTLAEDLARRDLTINAMARDLAGNLIDPYEGRADLAAGVLRHVTAAFVEDPLRVLRVARFAARFDFAVAPETLTLMREMSASGELDALVPERVWTEIERALGEPHPRRFIEVLRECGALAVLIPELDRLFGVPQTAKYHPEIDTGIHVLLALDLAAERHERTAVRFAVLVHDFGKGLTPPEILPHHHGHEQRGVALVQAFCDRLKAPREYREIAVLVTREHSRIHRAQELRPATMLELLEGLDALRRPERFTDILTACEIDARGRLGRERDPYPQKQRLLQARACVATVDIAPIVAGGLAGTAMKEAIRLARIAALKAHLTR